MFPALRLLTLTQADVVGDPLDEFLGLGALHQSGGHDSDITELDLNVAGGPPILVQRCKNQN